MGSTSIALLGVLVFLALGLTWFAIRVNLMLWRLPAAILWLVVGILVWTNTLGSSTTDPWTYALALALLVMIIAVLSLQMKADIRHEASVRGKMGNTGQSQSYTSFENKPKKNKKPTAAERQAEYKELLRGKTGRR